MPVREDAVDRTPSRRCCASGRTSTQDQPRVLLVAPMSGHFATLLRGTIRTMLPDHDVYVTDWHNARDVPLEHGRFGLDEFVDHVIRFLEAIGPDAHVVAVCQPCVAVLAAVAAMAEDRHPAQPRSMTLMAGPIDARVNPTRSTARDEPSHRVVRAPPRRPRARSRFRGAGRLVYPGFMQLAAFMSMNLERHVQAHAEMYAPPGARRGRPGPRDARVLRRVLRRDRPARRVLSRHRRADLPAAPARHRTAGVARPPRRSPRDPPHRACSRSRARRTTSAPSARPWPRTISARACASHAAPPRADGRRPLRRVQRLPLAGRDLPSAQERHPGGRVSRSVPSRTAQSRAR